MPRQRDLLVRSTWNRRGDAHRDEIQPAAHTTSAMHPFAEPYGVNLIASRERRAASCDLAMPACIDRRPEAAATGVAAESRPGRRRCRGSGRLATHGWLAHWSTGAGATFVPRGVRSRRAARRWRPVYAVWIDSSRSRSLRDDPLHDVRPDRPDVLNSIIVVRQRRRRSRRVVEPA